MGCFSYICKECGDAILAGGQASNGQHVRLTLLKDGKKVEEMVGPYDSYGGVFEADGETTRQWTSMEWNTIVDLCFDDNPGNGVAAVHTICDYSKTEYTTQSKDDPNQGWEDAEEEDDEDEYEDDEDE